MSEKIRGLVVAKSRKNHAYCIAILCLKDLQLYRLVSENEDSDHSVPVEYLIDEESGRYIEERDVVIFTVKSLIPIKNHIQKENLKLDMYQSPKIVGRMEPDHIKYYYGKLLKENNTIFVNKCDRLQEDEAEQSSCSLILAEVVKLKFHVIQKCREDGSVYDKCVADFTYRGILHQRYSVTFGMGKQETIKTYMNKSYERAVVLFSLSGKNYKGYGYYKFLAALLTDE